MLFIAYTGRVIGIISQPESKTIIHHVTNCWCWVGREREGTQNYCKECLKYWQHSHTHSWTFILLSCCNKVGMITEIISWLIGTFFPHREMKKCHGSLCVYILWVVGRYLDSMCVLCLWEINPSLVISLSDIARNESAVLFIALHRAAITSVPNALACDICTYHPPCIVR